MKKMSIQQTLFEVINFTMTFLFVIPLGVLVEQLCGHPLYRCCFIPCVAVLGHILGRISLKKQSSVAMILCGAGAIIALALSLLLGPGLLLVTILEAVLSLFFAVFFFFTARKAGYAVYAPMAVTGILIHIVVLICCTGFQWDDAVGSFTSTVAIIYFLLSLFSFSSKGLRKSMHKGSGEKRVTYPAGMQMGNFLLVTGFILIAAFISNIHPIFVIFSKGFMFVLKAIVLFFSLFTGLFSRRAGSVPLTEEAAAKPVSSEDNIMAYAAKGEATWITTMVEIIAFICVLLFVMYAMYKLMMKLRASGSRLPAFLRNLRDKFSPMDEEDYVDETESLMDAKKMLSDTGARLKNTLKKLRERPQKIDDFTDPRMKVRFAFQQLLIRVSKRNPAVLHETPNEIYRDEYKDEAEFREFLDHYNEARYSNSVLGQDAADSAESILKQKL